MSTLLLLTNALQPSSEVVPALGLLLHKVRVAPAEVSALLDAPPGRRDPRRRPPRPRPRPLALPAAAHHWGRPCPLFLVMTEGGLSVVTAEWGIDDVLLDTTGPAEVEARLRLATGRLELAARSIDAEDEVIRSGELTIDEATYSARLKGRRSI